MSTKYCQHCRKIIGKECIICPECGKQVEYIGMSPQMANLDATPSIPKAPSTPPLRMSPYAIPPRNTTQYSSPYNKSTTLLLAVFFGFLGIHRIYVGKLGTGLIWFFSFGLFGIGWLADIIQIASNSFKDSSNRIINS